ncbi:uncharacterized protein CLUP02_16783 [Colletotrichum lupini]|uniref:Uncharacterized protein n=1 Tax=Colletotrichum lupini TaxID=145971 RepID=A0A9Q8T8L8_9PEZI|nr:uncharacterized protein CLUP02_16783 [Colletotrichum lupini]UQC91249.1 hypothetical protein CLUP02_16783 [Colletotrichum lupini]
MGRFRAQFKTHGLPENVAGLAMPFLALEKDIELDNVPQRGQHCNINSHKQPAISTLTVHMHYDPHFFGKVGLTVPHATQIPGTGRPTDQGSLKRAKITTWMLDSVPACFYRLQSRIHSATYCKSFLESCTTWNDSNGKYMGTSLHINANTGRDLYSQYQPALHLIDRETLIMEGKDDNHYTTDADLVPHPCLCRGIHNMQALEVISLRRAMGKGALHNKGTGHPWVPNAKDWLSFDQDSLIRGIPVKFDG